MSTPRCHVVDPSQIQVLHVFNRCVRRAFLCGHDAVSGKDYSHRKDWIRQRLKFLTGIFAFDIATYAVMSNHFHLVVRSRPDIVTQWSDEEVALRVMRLQGKTWFRKDGTPRGSAAAEIERLTLDPAEIVRMRRKLSDLSSLMSYFDRHLAVRANQEDEVTGSFWEGTFGAELLEDENSVMACMAYVDLNPIRAMMAKTLEDSEFTGAFDRITEMNRQMLLGRFSVTNELSASQAGQGASIPSAISLAWERQGQPTIGWLAPIQLDERRSGPDLDEIGRRPSKRGFLPVTLQKYLEIVAWTGEKFRTKKQGIDHSLTRPNLDQLDLDAKGFLDSVLEFGERDRYFRRTERQGVPQRPFGMSHSA